MSNMKNHGDDDDDDDDETTTTTIPTCCKRIQLSDGAIVWITDDRLGRLYQGLPVLQYLLEGHPGMTKKPRPQDDSLYDFCLDETYGIHQQEWSLLVGFFSPARLPPTKPEDWDRLKRAANVLGSSDDVDKAYLLDVQNRMVRPSDDRQEVFEWLTIVGAEVNGGLNSHRQQWLRTKMEEGFVLVNDGPNASLGQKRPGEPCQHFRKRKRQQPHQEDATEANVTAAT
jgi:hypothetical protein